MRSALWLGTPESSLICSWWPLIRIIAILIAGLVAALALWLVLGLICALIPLPHGFITLARNQRPFRNLPHRLNKPGRYVIDEFLIVGSCGVVKVYGGKPRRLLATIKRDSQRNGVVVIVKKTGKIERFRKGSKITVLDEGPPETRMLFALEESSLLDYIKNDSSLQLEHN